MIAIPDRHLKNTDQLSYYLQKSIECIDNLNQDEVTPIEEIELIKKNFSVIFAKLKSKRINIGSNNTVSFVDNNVLDGIMNQMIEYAELNFSNQLQINGDDDIINTIATTVNILGEELEEKIKKLQELNITLEITAEKSEAKTKELSGIMKALDNSALIFITDKQGCIVKANHSFCDISGYTEDELLGRHHGFVHSTVHPEEFWQGMRDSIENGVAWRNEILCLSKGRSEFWVDIVVNPITDVEGQITHYLSIGRLITEKKLQEAKLIENEKLMRRSLEEKGILLQEVHHRVKNNLQIISSLMGLQIKRAKNAEVITQLTDSQKRIHAISLLHEKLYQSENISQIDISDYTFSLISSFANLYGENTESLIMVKHKIQKNIYLDIARAIPFGLIFNEIISNCYKHAFKEGEKGSIFITLNKTENKIQLTVLDSGKGISNDFELKKVKSLGLKVISSLSEKLKAEVNFKNKNGLEVSINFMQ